MNRNKVVRKGTLGTPAPEEILDQGKMEEAMGKAGYQVLSKIVIKRGDTLEAGYLEALNNLGQKVLIELDQKGFVSTRPTDMIMSEAPAHNLIPHSIKKGCFECAGMDVSGVAIICHNDVCTLVRDENGSRTR